MLQQYLISIDARLRSRDSTVSVKAETAECLVARDSIIAYANIWVILSIKDNSCPEFLNL